MAGRVPAIHDFLASCWKDVDARHKARHDEYLVSRTRCGILHAAAQSRDTHHRKIRAREWAPALQRTVPQELRAALRPGHELFLLEEAADLIYPQLPKNPRHEAEP